VSIGSAEVVALIGSADRAALIGSVDGATLEQKFVYTLVIRCGAF
jgi:hypothetical protein